MGCQAARSCADRPWLVVGTPAYMAPEQHRNGHVDLRADIYSLGATAYHALVGRPPFQGRTVWDIMASKMSARQLSFAGMSAESAALIQSMIAADPRARIQSHEALIARIDRLPLERARPRSCAIRLLQAHCPHLIVTAGVVLALAIGIRAGGRPTVAADNPPPVEYVSTGRIESLFDGVSLIAGRQPVSGRWPRTMKEPPSSRAMDKSGGRSRPRRTTK